MIADSRKRLVKALAPSFEAMPSVSSRSTLCLPVVVNIGSTPIAKVLSTLYTTLEQSGGTRLLSVQILCVENAQAIAVLEAITIGAVLKMLETELHRMQELAIRAHWRSSLDEVTRLFYPGSQGLSMFYKIDDVTV